MESDGDMARPAVVADKEIKLRDRSLEARNRSVSFELNDGIFRGIEELTPEGIFTGTGQQYAFGGQIAVQRIRDRRKPFDGPAFTGTEGRTGRNTDLRSSAVKERPDAPGSFGVCVQFESAAVVFASNLRDETKIFLCRIKRNPLALFTWKRDCSRKQDRSSVTGIPHATARSGKPRQQGRAK